MFMTVLNYFEISIAVTNNVRNVDQGSTMEISCNLHTSDHLPFGIFCVERQNFIRIETIITTCNNLINLTFIVSLCLFFRTLRHIDTKWTQILTINTAVIS